MHAPWLFAMMLALSARDDGGTVAPGTRPACVAVSWFARFQGVGYGHWVVVSNQCVARVSCTITTTANPAPTSISLPAGESTTVNMFFTSPASGFTPTVRCTQERG